MGRSLEVRRKSENLPVVSFVCPVFSRFGTRCEFLVLSFRTAISFVGTAVFLFCFLNALAIRAKEAQKGERGLRQMRK